jgi:hypothetical protein
MIEDRIIYRGRDKLVKRAVYLVNLALVDKRLYSGIESHMKFSGADSNPYQISKVIKFFGIQAKVVTYKNPFGIANAKVKSNTPATIRINRCKYKAADLIKLCRTIGHEYTHVVDNHKMHMSFGHGINKPDMNYHLTAPEVIGDIVGQLCEDYIKRLNV